MAISGDRLFYNSLQSFYRHLRTLAANSGSFAPVTKSHGMIPAKNLLSCGVALLTTLLVSYKPAATPGGIVYFSSDNGNSWQNKSAGLPKGVFLTDIAPGNGRLAISTKQNGLFFYDPASSQWKALGQKPTAKDVDALALYNHRYFAGTHGDGVFASHDGTNWKMTNQGLSNLVIRKLDQINQTLFAATNNGLYRFDAAKELWEKEFTNDGMQVNAVIEFNGRLHIATNRGAFRKEGGAWKEILGARALHNIGSANGELYAMVYNELFVLSADAKTWQSAQKGMADGLYTFEVKQSGTSVLAAQWDGVYKLGDQGSWKLHSAGLPEKFAVTELENANGFMVAASSGWAE